MKLKSLALVRRGFKAAFRRKGWLWRLLSVAYLHTRGYVGLTQAEARIFISEEYLSPPFGVAWRIASDVESGSYHAKPDRYQPAVAKITRSKLQKSQLVIEATKACNARLWIPLSERASIRCQG